MSYDLYLYHKKGKVLKEDEFIRYIKDSGFVQEENATTFIFENNNTGVYYLIDKENEPNTDFNINNLSEYQNTEYIFQLNFIRPDFFGKEAFLFIDKLINKFDLYILDYTDPHSNEIYKPKKDELYLTWSKANEHFSKNKDFYKDLSYYPLKKSSDVWGYNFRVKEWQDELGDDYFVPRIFYFKKKNENEILTITTWTQHIPTILPRVDYIILNKKIKKWWGFKEKTEVVSYDDLIDKIKGYYKDFKDKGIIIINRESSDKLGEIFNSIQELDLSFESIQIVSADFITNVELN